MIAATAGALLSTSPVGRTQSFGKATHGKDSEFSPNLKVLAQASVKNEVIRQSLNDTAAEFERIATLAAKRQSDPAANSLGAITAVVNKLKGAAPDQIYRNLADRISDMSEAQKNGDFEGVALAAAEGYRTARLAQDPAHLAAPVEVYMLEYTGLKALALAGADSPDWSRLAAINEETSNYWAEISPRVKQIALRNLTDRIISGFKLALAQANVTELRFVIKLQFDAANLLKSDLIKQKG